MMANMTHPKLQISDSGLDASIKTDTESVGLTVSLKGKIS